MDKRGYNYRICCLYSLGAVIKHLIKDVTSREIVPILERALKDPIPNVQFTAVRVIGENR